MTLNAVSLKVAHYSTNNILKFNGMTDGSRILCYNLGFVCLVFTVIINNKPRILILMLCVRQSWLLWQQAVVKIANISLFFTY